MNVKRTPMDKNGNTTGPTETGDVYFYRGKSTGLGFDARLGKPTMYFQGPKGCAQRMNMEDKIEPVQ